MSDEMQLALHDIVDTVLGLESRAEWDEHRPDMEIAGFEDWKTACDLAGHPRG